MFTTMQTSNIAQSFISTLNQNKIIEPSVSISDKGSILMVDDDAFLLDMYSNRLNKNGYDAVVCSSAEEALNVLRSGKEFNLVLLDIIMPGMSGFELLEKMREENLSTDSIKVILSNMSDQSDVVERGNQFGVTNYVLKAESTPSDVLSLVDRLINMQ